MSKIGNDIRKDIGREPKINGKKKVKHGRNKLLIADLHVMSHYALTMDKFEGENGQVYMGNDGQRRLFRYWTHLCKNTWFIRKCDEAWIVGDVFSGLNPREYGRKTSGTLDDQKEMAKEIILMLPKRLKLKIWSGTPYHESADTRMHKDLADKLRLAGRDVEFKGSWSFMKAGTREGFVTHEASSAVDYPHTPMVRSSRWFHIQYSTGKLPKISFIVRAHKHSYNYIDDFMHVVQIPGWSAFTPYQQSTRRFSAWQPDYGAVFLELDEEDRLSFKPWLYPPFIIEDVTGKIIETDYDPKRYVQGW